MKIALCQINTIVGDFRYNRDKILKYYLKCIDKSANIVVFPELCISGYPPQDLLLDHGFIEENLTVLNSIALESKVPLILGYIRKEGSHIYNSAAVCYNGKVQSSCDKILLPTYDVFDEERYFNSGENPKVVTVPNHGGVMKIGLQICEDLWDEDYDCKVSAIQKKLGAEIIINISASPYHEERLQKRQDVILDKVRQTQLPFMYCNSIGGQDELIFDGQSMAFSSNGILIGCGEAFEEDIVLVDSKLEKEVNVAHKPREEKIYNALCLGLKDYFLKTGHTDAVLGLSGGIDSALVASIAADALGHDKVHAISLPSKYSSEHSLSDAKELVNNLEIDYKIIPIQEAVDELESLLHPHFLGTDRNVAEENIQSRIRGNLLMALSNKFGWMVLSTGNKTELALGYCTLYGDMSGGLSVVSDLSKSDVYALSHWINTIYPGRIPLGTLTKPPSAELAPDQVDPFDYDIVSPLVDAIVEDGKTINELVQNGIDKDLVNSIYNRIRINEYKRRQAAPGLRVSSKAFGMGRRFPIVNHFQSE